MKTTRRDFLRKTGGAATAGAVLSQLASPKLNAQSKELLPTIHLGKHRVTRLIIGGNPIYGHSHFNRILSTYQTDWHTPDRVVQLLRHAEEQGINTWQNSYAERTLSDLDKFREAGGTMNWLCLGKPDWDKNPHLIADAAKRKPIGIAPHGALAEKLHRDRKLDVLKDLLKRIRDTDVLVGLSAHNPAVIQLAEERGWDVDYYMCCLYYLTRPAAEFKQLMGGEIPLGEVYLPSDPPRMYHVVRSTKKPCLVYKILAAGRLTDSPALVENAFKAAFANIKPNDALIVGMYLQQQDQVAQNAQLVRKLGA